MDSDSSEVLPSKSRRTQNFSLDDSDSDDSLLCQKTTFRKKRRLDSAKAKAERCLEDAVQSCRERTEQQTRISLIQHRTSEEIDDSWLEHVKRDKSPSKGASPADTEGTEDHPQTTEQRKRLRALEDNTEKTSSWGTRCTISQCMSIFPRSRGHALECLERLLREHKGEFSSKTHNLITSKLKSDALDFALLRSKFRRQLISDDLPKSLIRWFFIVACSKDAASESLRADSLEVLSRGSLKLLLELSNQPSVGVVVTWDDFMSQLGLFLIKSNEKMSAISEYPQQCEQSLSSAFPRFLAIWNAFFQRKMVSLDDMTAQAKDCIVPLLFAGLDPTFDNGLSHNIDATKLLHKNMVNLLQASETRKDGHAHIKETLKEFIPGMTLDSVQLEQKAARPSDSEAWLSCSRIARLLFLSEDNDRTPEQSYDLSSAFCHELLLSLFPEENWADIVSDVLEGWGVGDGARDWTFGKCFAIAFLALKYMNTTDLEKEAAPKCLAILDISCLCLQIANSQLRRFKGMLDKKKRKEFLNAALQDCEQQCASLERKTNGLSLGKAHFLRLNYYTTCSRQYARLERSVVKAQKQGTLEKWL